MTRVYPELQIDLRKIMNNSSQIVSRCKEKGISVCGVIKGCSGLPRIAKVIDSTGVSQLGTSRIEHVIECQKYGIMTPFILLRIPAMSEIKDVIRLFEYSLESELSTVTAIDRACNCYDMHHKVIMMVDLGDLREGYWDKQRFIDDCVFVENELQNVYLSGVGVNLGCYGAIKPTVAKMNELISIAKTIENRIQRPLDVVSGGATTSFPLVHYNTMPRGINHLRIGDNILLSRGLQTNWGIHDMDYLDMTSFLIRAEIVEVREKPSVPQGEYAFNAYGKRPDYKDNGIRKRALVALGNADVGDVRELVPVNDSLSIIGGSSDYMILDVTNVDNITVGQIVEFFPRYINMLHMTSNPYIRIRYL